MHQGYDARLAGPEMLLKHLGLNSTVLKAGNSGDPGSAGKISRVLTKGGFTFIHIPAEALHSPIIDRFIVYAYACSVTQVHADELERLKDLFKNSPWVMRFPPRVG